MCLYAFEPNCKCGNLLFGTQSVTGTTNLAVWWEKKARGKKRAEDRRANWEKDRTGNIAKKRWIDEGEGGSPQHRGPRSRRSCFVAIDRRTLRWYASRTRAMKNDDPARSSSAAWRAIDDGRNNFHQVHRSRIANSATRCANDVDHKKRKTDGKEKKKRKWKREWRKWRGTSEIESESPPLNTGEQHDEGTRQRGGGSAVTLNSVWIRPRALFAANFSARCRFVQRFYRRIEQIRIALYILLFVFLCSTRFFPFSSRRNEKKCLSTRSKGSRGGSLVEEVHRDLRARWKLRWRVAFMVVLLFSVVL